MTETTEPRSERVDLRMTPAAKRTLQRAAAVNDKTLSEFLLDSGLTAASKQIPSSRKIFPDFTRRSVPLLMFSGPT